MASARTIGCHFSTRPRGPYMWYLRGQQGGVCPDQGFVAAWLSLARLGQRKSIAVQTALSHPKCRSDQSVSEERALTLIQVRTARSRATRAWVMPHHRLPCHPFSLGALARAAGPCHLSPGRRVNLPTESTYQPGILIGLDLKETRLPLKYPKAETLWDHAKGIFGGYFRARFSSFTSLSLGLSFSIEIFLLLVNFSVTTIL